MAKRPKKPSGKRKPSAKKYRDYILDELEATQDLRKEHPFYDEANFVPREVYRYTRWFLTRGKHEQLLRKAAWKGVRVGSDRTPDYFSAAFRLLLGDLSCAPAANNRSKYCIQMRYAYEHDVKPIDLHGFIFQAGGYEKIRRKLRDGRREPWRETRPEYPFHLAADYPPIEDNAAECSRTMARESGEVRENTTEEPGR